MSCRVVHEGQLTKNFEVRTGVRQGCLLSPFLFILVIDWVMKTATKEKRNGIQWTMLTQLDDLDFADDLALLSHSHRQMQDKTTELALISAQVGLKINKRKTKILRTNTTCETPIMLEGETLDEVKDFRYLGSIVDTLGGTEADVKKRISKARVAFHLLRNVWKSKVYLPCILQTKKRYVGFMYETPDQKEPVFDAKGIETVRRDSCAAVSKVLERSIKQLFTTSDISLVKAYVQTQCRKLLEGHVSMQDCIFAKEYRGLTGYKPTACVPALEIARRLLSKDHQAEPRVGQRVPYVIVHGTPGLPLIQLVRQPQELLLDPELRLNGTYYVTKQVLPPLARVFSLIGIDVFAWYTQLPKTVRVMPPAFYNEQNKKGTISQYFTSLSCPVCEEVTNHGMCDRCRRDPQRRAVVLSNRIRHAERALLQISQICASCMSMVDTSQPCVSLDCPVLYRHHRASGQFNQVLHLEQLKTKLLQF
ncbi:DNA polymerase zeta catalytic subunit [Lamellibrachia satsuma]|nr:DNA polymerase zeta catalytic subunit [Lamellibrachia satsuma]